MAVSKYRLFIVLYVSLLCGFALPGAASAAVSIFSGDIPGDEGSSYGLSITDFNGDGHVDIYVANAPNQQNKLWLNDGNNPPTFTAADIAGDLGVSFGSAAGDLNGDGHMDIYVANYNQQNRIWLNDGNNPPTFTAASITGDAGSSRDAIIADMNGDDHMDIYVVNEGQQNRLWINDGSNPPTFTAADIVGDDGPSYSAAIADLNSDGYLDIYVPNLSGQQNRLWLNDGNNPPTFTAADIVGDTGNSTAAAIADINGDGHLDVYSADTAQSRLWIHDGNNPPTFTAADIAGDTGNTRDVDIADINGDGHQDIYVSNFSQQNRLWIHDGNNPPTFTAADISGDTGRTFAAAVADLTSNGALDIYVANLDGEQNKLWLQIATPVITTITNSKMVRGTSTPGYTVTITASTGHLCTATVNPDGTYECELPHSQPGGGSLTAQARTPSDDVSQVSDLFLVPDLGGACNNCGPRESYGNAPAPTPESEPVSQPEPQPTPAPEPQPAPAPTPEPEPQPVCTLTLPTERLKEGARDGRFHFYNRGTATQVALLQQKLNELLNTTLVTDGIFGPNTKAAVEQFQAYLNLTTSSSLDIDGVYGPATQSTLVRYCEAG